MPTKAFALFLKSAGLFGIQREAADIIKFFQKPT